MNGNIDVNLIAHRDLLGVGNDPFLALQGAISLSRPPDVLLRSGAFIQQNKASNLWARFLFSIREILVEDFLKIFKNAF